MHIYLKDFGSANPRKTILQYFTYNSNWFCGRFALFQDGAINREIAYYFQIKTTHVNDTLTFATKNNKLAIKLIFRSADLQKKTSLGYLKRNVSFVFIRIETFLSENAVQCGISDFIS